MDTSSDFVYTQTDVDQILQQEREGFARTFVEQQRTAHEQAVVINEAWHKYVEAQEVQWRELLSERDRFWQGELINQEVTIARCAKENKENWEFAVAIQTKYQHLSKRLDDGYKDLLAKHHVLVEKYSQESSKSDPLTSVVVTHESA